MKVLFLILLAFSALFQGSAALGTKGPGFEWQNSPSKEAAKEVIRSRQFSARRDLVAYLADFPPAFSQDLLKLGANARVLDAGAGAFYFVEDLVSLRKVPAPAKNLAPAIQKALTTFVDLPLSQRPNVTGVSLNLERKNIPSYEGRLKLFWGRFFAEIPKEELGRFDLITDLKGIFAYSPDADEVLRRYTELLTDNGVLYLYLGDNEKDGFAYQSSVRTGEGSRIALAQWIQSLPGLKATLIRGTGLSATESQGLTLRITIEDRSKVRIPTLSLLGIDSQTPGPPLRVYWQR